MTLVSRAIEFDYNRVTYWEGVQLENIIYCMFSIFLVRVTRVGWHMHVHYMSSQELHVVQTSPSF